MDCTFKPLRAILSILLILTMLLAACSPDVVIEPGVDDLAKISPAVSFLAAKVEESEGFIAASDPKEKESGNAYLYDNALAAIALSQAGAHWHAQKIADAIVFAQGHDRTFQDGRLRNAYISGDPKSDSGRSIAAGKATIRLPGSWQDGRWQENPYAVSTSTGNMAWAIAALCTVAEKAPADQGETYLEAARQAGDFALTLQSDTGGFTAGYEGWDDVQTRATYKSTEHNIDLAYAFSLLANALLEKDPEKADLYLEAAEEAKAFVFSMYDKDLHCFYTGTESDGITINQGVIPLDTNTLAILSFTEEMQSIYQTIAFIEKRMAVGDGFDFSAGDLDGIWNEGTAQMAVCYAILKNTEKYQRVMAYLQTQTAKDGSIPAADRDGVSTGFLIIGTDTLWEYHNVQSISATSWLAFAQMNCNPFKDLMK